MRSGEDDDTDAANELLTRAMEILPDYGAGHFNLGLTKHLLGDIFSRRSGAVCRWWSLATLTGSTLRLPRQTSLK